MMTLPNEILQGTFRIEPHGAFTKSTSSHRNFVRLRGQMVFERFFYIEQGTFIFNENTEHQQTFTAGDIVYLPSDITYISRWEQEETGRYTTLNFSLYDTQGNPFSLGDSIALLIRDKHEEFYSLFHEVAQKWSRGSHGYRLEITSLLYKIFYHLAMREEQETSRSGQKKMDKAILFLENNYLTNITTSELAAMAGISECMFRRTFHKVMGISPVRYRNHLRLTKARELLQSGEFTVLEAALLTGFDDPGYFSRLFLREFGIRPSECLDG